MDLPVHLGGQTCWRRPLYRYLCCQKKRRKRYGSYDKRGKWLSRVSIDERPDIVITRQRPGDWEVDTIIGKGRLQVVVSPIASHPNDC